MSQKTHTNVIEPIADHGTKSDGSKVLRGHHAVDPSGHLVLLPGNDPLPKDEGWRWATQHDLKDAEAAEELNKERDEREATELQERHAELRAAGELADASRPRKGGPLRK